MPGSITPCGAGTWADDAPNAIGEDHAFALPEDGAGEDEGRSPIATTSVAPGHALPRRKAAFPPHPRHQRRQGPQPDWRRRLQRHRLEAGLGREVRPAVFFVGQLAVSARRNAEDDSW